MIQDGNPFRVQLADWHPDMGRVLQIYGSHVLISCDLGTEITSLPLYIPRSCYRFPAQNARAPTKSPGFLMNYAHDCCWTTGQVSELVEHC